MIAILLGLVLSTVFLWSVSVGALLQVRAEERRGLAGRCPAWVPLPQVDGALYRCGTALRAGEEFCGAHAQPARRNWPERHPDWQRVDRTREWADARNKMRWGLPLGAIAVVTAAAVAAAVV